MSDGRGLRPPSTLDCGVKTKNVVGWRPLLQGVLLWLLVGFGSLALIRAGLIGFSS